MGKRDPGKHSCWRALLLVARKRRKSCLGLSVIELIIVMAIIGTLVSIAVPRFLNYKNKAKIGLAIADIELLEKEILLYQIDHGKPPGTLADIGRGNYLDPWGNPYQYLNFSTIKGKNKGKMRKDRFLVPLNSDYDLYSMGADGKTASPLTAQVSYDDIVRANDGAFIGLGKEY